MLPLKLKGQEWWEILDLNQTTRSAARRIPGRKGTIWEGVPVHWTCLTLKWESSTCYSLAQLAQGSQSLKLPVFRIYGLASLEARGLNTI